MSQKKIFSDYFPFPLCALFLLLLLFLLSFSQLSSLFRKFMFSQQQRGMFWMHLREVQDQHSDIKNLFSFFFWFINQSQQCFLFFVFFLIYFSLPPHSLSLLPLFSVGNYFPTTVQMYVSSLGQFFCISVIRSNSVVYK